MALIRFCIEAPKSRANPLTRTSLKQQANYIPVSTISSGLSSSIYSFATGCVLVIQFSEICARFHCTKLLSSLLPTRPSFLLDHLSNRLINALRIRKVLRAEQFPLHDTLLQETGCISIPLDAYMECIDRRAFPLSELLNSSDPLVFSGAG
jgi:hypothetical protein